MKRPEGAFRFTPALGRRLRELRERAGLSRAEVARRMGRTGRGSGNIVGRLERAETVFPTFGLVADFLKACGATFRDVLDILDEHTGKPKRRRRTKSHSEQVAGVRRKAARIRREERVEELLFGLAMQPGMAEDEAARLELVRKGRELYRRLEREHRQQRRAGAGEEASESQVEAAVRDLFSRMAEAGDLDRSAPVDAEAVLAGREKLKNVKRAERRLSEQRLFKLGWRRQFLYFLKERIRLEVTEAMREEKVDRPARYGGLAVDAVQVAHEHDPGSAYRREWLAERVGRARDPERARRVIEQGYRTYDEHCHELPPLPENWRGVASNPGKHWLIPE